MIFIYDNDEKQIAHFDITPLLTEEIGKVRTLEFTAEQEFKKGYRVVYNLEGINYEFIIVESEYNREDETKYDYYCQDSIIELQSVPILDKRPMGTIKDVINSIFQGTRWTLEVRRDYNLSQTSTNSFYHITAFEAFAESVEKYRAEWKTEFKTVGAKITERRVVLYQKDGRSEGRLEFGKNIKKFTRRILPDPIVTAIYPFGKGEQLENGSYGRRIGIESVNNGIPYIENKEATEKYGYGEAGNKQPLFGFLVLDEITEPTLLKTEAAKELEIVSQMRAEYLVDAIYLDFEAKIGYEVPVVDDKINYSGYSRIIKLVRYGKEIQVTFGTITKKFIDTFQKELKRTEEGLIEVFKQVTLAKVSADGKTTIFTGAAQPQNPNEGDQWFRYNDDGSVDILFFKNGIWDPEVGAGVFKKLNDELEASKIQITEAQQTAEAASSKIDAEVERVNQNITNLTEDLAGFDAKLATKADSQAVVDLKQTVDGFSGKITETNSKIDNLQIGTRNLILETGIKTEVATIELSTGGTYTNNSDGTTTIQGTGKGVAYATIKINGSYPAKTTLISDDVGKNVILSWDVKLDKKANISIYSPGFGGYVLVKGEENCVGKWGRIYLITTLKTDIKMSFHVKFSTADATVQLGKNVQLEFGTIPSDYKPAPEDMATAKSLNEFKVTAEGNFQKITNIETDLKSGSTFQKIQTIEQTAEGNKTTIAEVKKTADGAVQLTAFNTTINNVNESISTIGKRVDDNQNIFNEFKRTADQTLSIISDPNQNGLLSVINQQAGNILFQIGDAGQTSKINLTKAGTVIDTALIQTAHIADAAITDAKIGNITFNWATGKTLNAQQVNVINIDANNITANRTTFVQSAWNSISSSVSIDGNGIYLQGDWGGEIHFTRRGQTYYDKIKGQVMGYQYGLYRTADDPLVNSQMLGIAIMAEMGYDLRLGIRKQIDNQNNTYMAIKSAGGTATRAEIFGNTKFMAGIDMNGSSIQNAANAGYTSTSNSNGICFEFSNGFKIQFKRMSYTTRSTGFEGWGYPKPFTALPYVFGNAVRDDTLAAKATIAFSNVNQSACNVRISETTNSYSILVMAIGF